MVKRKYIPRRGDVVWVTLNPSKGHEQQGRRPALVVSPAIYNEKTSLALICPITSHMKEYPFEVALYKMKTKGVVLSDHLRSIDWRSRKVKYVETADTGITTEIQEKINQLIFG